MDAGQSAQGADMGAEHCGAACVLERERCDVSSPSPPTKQRSLRVVYVLNDGLKSVMASSPESGALQCLQRACDAESALLTTVTFGRLDFGETSVLDSFYDAGVFLSCFFFVFFSFLTHSEVLSATHEWVFFLKVVSPYGSVGDAALRNRGECATRAKHCSFATQTIEVSSLI